MNIRGIEIEILYRSPEGYYIYQNIYVLNDGEVDNDMVPCDREYAERDLEQGMFTIRREEVKV